MRRHPAPLFGLGDLLLRRIFQDVDVQAVPHVDVGLVAAGLAHEVDVLLADLDARLWVAARMALHVLLDEQLQQLVQLPHLVSACQSTQAESLRRYLWELVAALAQGWSVHVYGAKRT